jgi:lysophospholipase L1-like esterase
MSLRIVLLRVFIVMLAVLVPLVALELALREFGPFLPGRYSAHMSSAPHPLYGFARVPGTIGWVKSEEFLSRVAINSHGLREREIPYSKSPGNRRILVLGDSFVEAVQVTPEETFARVVESRLEQQRPADSVDVINAGSGGWGTAQEYEFLRHEGLQYEPDIIVLVFYTGNDVTDNSFRIKGNVRNLRKPYYALRDGRLELQRWTPRRSDPGATQNAWNGLYLWNVFESGVLANIRPGANTNTIDDDDALLLDQLVDTEVRVFSTNQKSEWRDAWDVTEALFIAARDASEATGARFLLVNAPTTWEIYPARWSSFRDTNKLSADGWDLDVARRRMADLAARHGIEYLDLTSALRAAAPTEPSLYFSRDLHWTAAGHRVVAQALAERIEERFAVALGQ